MKVKPPVRKTDRELQELAEDVRVSSPAGQRNLLARVRRLEARVEELERREEERRLRDE